MGTQLKHGKAGQRTMRSNANETRRIRRFLFLILSLAAALATLTCAGTTYWVPPKATETLPAEVASLLEIDPQVTSPPQGLSGTPLETESVPVSDTPPENSPTATATEPAVNQVPILYYTQAADTLPVVAIRFDVQPEDIYSPEPIHETGLLPPNQLLIIPRRLSNTTSSQHLLPDSEFVYSPSAVDFDIEAFVSDAGGYLSNYTEWLQTTKTTSGAEIITRIALDNSINPRLLLALLEYQSQWVYGQPANLAATDYPMGNVNLNQQGLYRQLVWAVNHLSTGYYSWREGRLTELRFKDGVTARLAPDLNAGTVALLYYFSQLYSGEQWVQALDQQNGLPALYERMFGNPWLRAQAVEPLYPPGLIQPPLILPFQVDRLWSFTGGPHGAWEHEGSYAALDFAPASSESGCKVSNAWATAAAAGLVVRSQYGVVIIDLDGDGFEQTGWALLYLHIADKGRVPVGTWVETGDPLGHPSCEGGVATGTHLHFARKYNGEWIAADGPMPFVLSGWQAHAGQTAYKGKLARDGEVIPASSFGSFETRITRSADDPYETGP